MSVSSLGVGSGLDLESLVTNMVNSQRNARVSQYESRIADYEAQVSGYGTLMSKLDVFQDAVDKLKDKSLFTARAVDVTNPSAKDLVSVTADDTASNGSYNIAVQQMAQGSRAVSAAGLFQTKDDVVTASGGDLTFTAGTPGEVGAETFTITVAANTTLSQLRDQINAEASNFGVSANLVDDGAGNVYLAMTSDVSGDGKSLSITNTDATLDSVSTVATGAGSAGVTVAPEDQAQNAIIEVDGIPITGATNSFVDSVSGLTIKVLAESETDAAGDLVTANASVSFDQETMEETLNEFVEAYNSIRSTLDEASGVDSVFSGSSLIRNLKNSLASNLMTTFSGAGNLTSMFDLGFKLDNDGKLSLDSTKLSEVVDSDFDSIAKMFSGNESLPEDGLGTILDNFLSVYTESNGLLNSLKASTQERVDAVEDDLVNFEYRMELYESQLRDRFATLDTTLASMNSSGSALLASLGNLPSYSSSS